MGQRERACLTSRNAIRWETRLLVAFGLLLSSVLPALPVEAQPLAVASQDDLFVRGREALDARRYEEAVRLLDSVFETQPAYVAEGQGAAAYWLGRAYAASGDERRASTIWQAGLGALELHGLFDVRLADAYVRAVFRQKHQRDYARAGALYLGLIARLDAPLSQEEQTLLTRHVAQMVFLLKDDLRNQVMRADDSIKEGAAAALLRWWRRQDPLPGTPRNERLEEHLQRVTHAERAYRYEGDRTGFDDRGEIYVRFGEPVRKRTISHNVAREYITVAYAPITAMDLLDNEFWTYNDIADEAYYLFVKRQGRYRISEVYDLIPGRLSRIKLKSKDPVLAERDGVQARALLEVLRDYYRQLAWGHSDFFSRYVDLDEYLLRLDPDKTKDTGPDLFLARKGRPDAFGTQMIGEGRMQDRQAAYQRDLVVPQQRSTVLDTLEPLDVRLRVARFLDEDGTTRTELYWSHLPRTLALQSALQAQYKDRYDTRDRFLLHLSAVQQSDDFTPRAVTDYRYVADAGDALRDSLLRVQTLVLRGDTETPYHLALQWDQHLTTHQETDAVVAGPHVKTGVYRVDSLAALNPLPSALEMSDLVPVLLSEESFDELSRYPWMAITPETPLGLYFEVYDLIFGPDDRTHFTAVYEIVRRQAGGLLRFLGGGEEERTSVMTSYEGSSRIAREYIALDLSAWSGEGDLEVRVQVRDETTGQEVERSVFFVLTAPSE